MAEGYDREATGNIEVNELGDTELLTDTIVGEIAKIAISYGNVDPMTRVVIKTMEDEEIINVVENNKDTVVYPRINIQTYDQAYAGQEGIGTYERPVSVGPLRIKISGAGKKKLLSNIVIFYRNP